MQIDRHLAAIPRKTMSRPVRLVLESGIFQEGMSFFDYGCGYGRDGLEVASLGYAVGNWDPFYAPNEPLIPSDIVNLGYVINVIENAQERREALLNAWELTQKILIVSAQVLIDDPNRGVMGYQDGIITRRNTFQKYFEQEELKSYIDQVLQVDAIPVGLGVYVIFREAEQAQAFQASRFHRRVKTPSIRLPVKRFEDYEQILRPLMDFYTQRGRLPKKGELAEELEIRNIFGNFQRAFQVVLQVTQALEWDEIREQRLQELLLYLALARFGQRPTMRQLSPALREDIRALLGSYEAACILADRMLYGLRDFSQLIEVCRGCSLGKKFKSSFVVHLDYVECLPTLLRLYEGCASRTVGRLEGANVVKFSLQEAKISYLVYGDFNRIAHPLLLERMDVYVSRLRVSYQDYRESDNPPILHEKDLLVGTDYPLHEKFAQLSQKERDRGLLDNYGPIRTRRGWEKCLEEYCSLVKGHQLFWRKDCDSYKLNFLKSQTNARKRKAESF
jgi:DNA phosphorothioation-associated putative methyltransferase